MTFSRSSLTLSGLAMLSLSLCSNAYATGETEAGRVLAASGASITIIAADHRETNLSKTATSLIVMGVESIQNPRKQR